jgi:type IV pilus assembly protein PilM
VAAPKRILAIDFGNSAIKVGCFQVDSVNGLSLLGYRIQELGVDPSQDEDRLAAIQPALTEAVDALGGRNLPVLCSLSGQYAFIRFVKLPPVSADQLDQMIGFEAQQNVPFPINEVVWDYQLISPGDGGGEISALLVAVKDDLVEANLRSTSDLSLDVVNVDVAPVTLINAYLYNYSSAEGCTLLIDIGARSTNLIFFEQDQVFARVVPIGGHMITQNISNEFQEPYKASEVMKKGKGFVGLGGAYQDPDDAVASRISKLSRSTYSRLHAEINRSISFYRNQQGGMAPHRILLAGGASSMAYSDLFFRDKFNIEVEYFNPLLRVAVSSDVDREALSRDAFALGEMVGLALRRAGECPVEINLRPQSMREETKKKSQMPILILALFVWLLAFLIAAGANFYRTMEVNKQIAVLESDLRQQDQRAKQIQSLNEQVIELKQTATELKQLTPSAHPLA